MARIERSMREKRLGAEGHERGERGETKVRGESTRKVVLQRDLRVLRWGVNEGEQKERGIERSSVNDNDGGWQGKAWQIRARERTRASEKREKVLNVLVYNPRCGSKGWIGRSCGKRKGVGWRALRARKTVGLWPAAKITKKGGGDNDRGAMRGPEACLCFSKRRLPRRQWQEVPARPPRGG